MKNSILVKCCLSKLIDSDYDGDIDLINLLSIIANELGIADMDDLNDSNNTLTPMAIYINNSIKTIKENGLFEFIEDLKSRLIDSEEYEWILELKLETI